jgi:hypothetical protein
VRGTEELMFDIVGISSLDYFALYKKYTYTTQESYKLDHIAFVELGEKKLHQISGTTFKEFYSGIYDVESVRPEHQEIDELGLRRTMMKKELIKRGLLN